MILRQKDGGGGGGADEGSSFLVWIAAVAAVLYLGMRTCMLTAEMVDSLVRQGD